jgi:zinc protease
LRARFRAVTFALALAGSWLAVASCAPSPPPVASAPVRAAVVRGPLAAAPIATAPPVTPDAPFRQAPPAPDASITWVPPRVDAWSLANGVHVLFVPRHDLPVVAVRVVSGAGAGDLAGVRPGAVAFMGAMLEQGAGKRGALELSDDFEGLGAEHGASCDWDSCVVRTKVLASRLEPALDLLADIVLRPTFPRPEFDRTHRRWVAGLQQEKNSPPAMEQNALAAVLYGREHPYGHGLRGAPADADALGRDEIERLWRRTFQPRTTTVVVAGDVSPETVRRLLDARFGGWRGGAVQRAGVGGASTPGASAERQTVRVALVDVPGAAQSQVFVAQPGPAFSVRDRIALGVMNAVLGGMFSSRINLDLREAHAYTYGAHSRFSMRHGPGPFSAGGAIFAEHTGDAVRALMAQVERIRSEPVTADELADAKQNAKLALPSRFEGVDDVAGALQELAVYDLPLDEYAARAARIDGVTAEDVQRVAKAWLHPEAMWVVVAGDRARVEHDLSTLGTVILRDAYGDPAK